MRAAAAVPAVGLLAGSACGLFLHHFPSIAAYTLLPASAAGAVWAWRSHRPRTLVSIVAAAFFVGGALLGADAWRAAWRPTLRAAFEDLARSERARAAAEHRFSPEDDEAFAIVEGVLRADAATMPSGVSLSIAVDGIEGQEGSARGPREHSESAPAAKDKDHDRRSALASGGGAARAVKNDGYLGLDGHRNVRGARLSISGGVIVTVVGTLAGERMAEWRAGRRVRLPIQLRRPSRYLDPGVPDHERALARRGTTLVGTVKSGALVELLARGTVLDEAMAAARAFSRRAVSDAVGRWSRRSAGIVAAIVIGDRAGLDQEVRRTLQEAGTYHVIAISGGNIAILAGLMLGVFRVAGLLGRSAMWSAIVALVAYGSFVGGGASVDRATLMAVVYFAGRAIDQRSPPMNALAFVAACLVATQPLSISDPGFVLTFGATLAILVVMPVALATFDVQLDRRAPASIAAVRRVARPLATVFAASLAAEMILFPVSALLFSRVTFAGLALNFLAIPLMALAQIAGLVVVPLALVSAPLAAVVGYVAHLGAAGLVRSASLVRFAPALTYRVAPPNWVAVALYYAAIAIAWTLWRRRAEVTGSAETRVAHVSRIGAAGVALCAAIWMLAEPWTLAASRADGRLRVTFIDVGQGDAALVRFPRGTTMLVDAGGLAATSTFDIGDRVVAPVLRDAGVRRLDVVALTHGDPDHIGGAASILREFVPREVWEGIPVPRFEPLRALHDEAQALGVRWSNVKAGDRIVLDDVDVRVRHPLIADWERQKVRNDDSIVIELEWRDVSVLLTGDIGRPVEKAIGDTLSPSRLRIVKVPHHGSLTSSSVEFVRAIAPRVAVVSAGRANHFGHPARDVLERYRAAGTEIFRTDRDGAVTVDTDGHSIVVRTFTGRTLSLK